MKGVGVAVDPQVQSRIRYAVSCQPEGEATVNSDTGCLVI